MKTTREFIRLAESAPLVLAVSALADYLWEDFVRDARPTVNYLIDKYNINQLSRFGKELFDYLYNGSAVTPIVSLDEIEQYFREKQNGNNPALPKNYKPESAFWMGVFADLCNAPMWSTLVARCVGDQFNSGNNAVNIINELSEVIEEQIEQALLPIEELSNGAAELQQLREDFVKAKEEGDDARAAELREKGKALGKQLEEMVSRARETMLPKTADIIDKVNKEAEDLEESMSQLAGTEAGVGKHQADLNEKKKLASKLSKNKKLQELARRLGGMRKAWNNLRRAKRTKTSYSDIVGAKFSDEVIKSFPTEIALAASPEGRALFGLKYAQKTLLTKDYEAKEKEVERGPVVMYIDISGSMSGMSELWSKAIAYTIAEECLKQKRAVSIHLFDSRVDSSVTLAADRKNNLELLDFVMTWVTKGGTSFVSVIDHAMSVAKIDPKADVLMITDGHAEVNDNFVRRLNNYKEQHGINWNSFCIGERSETLSKFSDTVHTVDITKDPETSEIFQSVLN